MAAEAATKAVLRPGCSAAVEVEGTGGASTRVVFVAECRSAKHSGDFLRLAAEDARAAALEARPAETDPATSVSGHFT